MSRVGPQAPSSLVLSAPAGGSLHGCAPREDVDVASDGDVTLAAVAQSEHDQRAPALRRLGRSPRLGWQS